MDDSGAVGAKLQPSGFGFLYDFGQVAGWHQGAGARVGHQAAAPQNPPQPANFGHYLRDGQAHVEPQPAAFNLGDKVVVAHIVGAGLPGDVGGFAIGEHQHPYLLAQAVGQHGHAAHLLLGMAHVGVGAQVYFHSFIKLGRGQIFYQVDSLAGLVGAAFRHTLGHGVVTAAVFGHFAILHLMLSRNGQSSATAIPMLRAVPAIICIA